MNTMLFSYYLKKGIYKPSPLLKTITRFILMEMTCSLPCSNCSVFVFHSVTQIYSLFNTLNNTGLNCFTSYVPYPSIKWSLFQYFPITNCQFHKATNALYYLNFCFGIDAIYKIKPYSCNESLS